MTESDNNPKGNELGILALKAKNLESLLLPLPDYAG
jgi:hypothetical protein